MVTDLSITSSTCQTHSHGFFKALYRLDPAFNPQELIGEEVMAKIAVVEMRDDSGASTGVLSNEIKFLSHPVSE